MEDQEKTILDRRGEVGQIASEEERPGGNPPGGPTFKDLSKAGSDYLKEKHPGVNIQDVVDKALGGEEK